MEILNNATGTAGSSGASLQTKSLSSKLLPWLVLALLAVFPVAAPWFGMEYYTGFVQRLLIYSIAVTSLNFLIGYGGMIALGHAGFLGIGAYTLVVLLDAGHDSAWLAWGLGALVAGVFSMLIGSISIRSKGMYFIMITLAFAQMLYYLAVSFGQYGGEDGYAIYTPVSLGGWLNNLPHALYWTVLFIAALVFAISSRVAHSRFGLALQGIRDNELRMAAMGYPVYAIRLLAFTVAGAFAGLAGAMLAVNNNFVSPSMMSFGESAGLLIMVILGGMGHRWGPAIGVAVWLTLAEVLKLYTDFWHWPMGLFLILAVFLRPGGLAGSSRKVGA
ncbi:MAG: branched-chain amino acid ABC transporter permease [Alcaligenaceae bacterium]|nr:branched-chain amino acid ABC transporter permease [Alcaligenaceae bacterium]